MHILIFFILIKFWKCWWWYMVHDDTWSPSSSFSFCSFRKLRISLCLTEMNYRKKLILPARHLRSISLVKKWFHPFIFEMFIIAKTDFFFALNKMPYVTVYAFILHDEFNMKLAILFSPHFKVKSMRWFMPMHNRLKLWRTLQWLMALKV